MAFEKFTAVGGSFSPKISLRSNGQIGVSQGALRKFMLEEGDWYTVLFYDKENNLIGIKPTRNEKTEGAIKLTKREIVTREGQRSLNSYISCKSFFEYYEIPTKKTVSYDAKLDEENKMIIVDLKQKQNQE